MKFHLRAGGGKVAYYGNPPYVPLREIVIEDAKAIAFFGSPDKSGIINQHILGRDELVAAAAYDSELQLVGFLSPEEAQAFAATLPKYTKPVFITMTGNPDYAAVWFRFSNAPKVTGEINEAFNKRFNAILKAVDAYNSR